MKKLALQSRVQPKLSFSNNPLEIILEMLLFPLQHSFHKHVDTIDE